MADGDDDDTENDYAQPIFNPVQRFWHLPKPTRQWLESLRPEDIAEIQESVRFYRNARAVGKFNKWALVTAVGALIGFAAFGDALHKIYSWFGPPAGKP